MTLRPRLPVALSAVFAASFLLAGCGDTEDEKAVDALCSEFQWSSARSDEENVHEMQAVMHRYDYADTTDEIIDQAHAQCRGSFAEYDRYTAEVREQFAGPSGEESTAPDPVEEDHVTEGPDTSVADELDRRGIDDAMVRQLGAMADATGYGLSPGTPLPFEQAQSFALVIAGVCDEVASGSLTWAESTAQDVADGAPVSDARQMNNYLRDVFCPAVS